MWLLAEGASAEGVCWQVSGGRATMGVIVKRVSPLMDERRKVDRVKVSLAVMWEGERATLKGEITDLSVNGCFVLTDDKVKVGESIKLEILQPRSGHLFLQGEVIYRMAEIGF